MPKIAKKKLTKKPAPKVKKMKRRVKYRFPGINRSRSRAVYCLESRLALTRRQLNVAIKRAAAASKIDKIFKQLSLANRRKLLDYGNLLQKHQ